MHITWCFLGYIIESIYSGLQLELINTSYLLAWIVEYKQSIFKNWMKDSVQNSEKLPNMTGT